MSEYKRKPFNVWKFLFLGSVAVCIAGYLYLATLSHQPSNPITRDIPSSELGQFHVSLSTESANQLIRKYIDGYAASETSDYQFMFTDKYAVIASRVSYLGVDIDVNINTIPHTLDNGAVQLTVDNIQLNGITLSNKHILMGLLSQINFPSFIELNLDKYAAIVNLQELQIGNDLYLTADAINLPANEIHLTGHLVHTLNEKD